MTETTAEVSAIEQAASIIGAAGYAAYSNSLVGNPAPMVAAYFERVRNPRPGDLVLETTTFMWRERRGFGHVAVGTLVNRVNETITEVEEGTGQPWTYSEIAWYVTPYIGGETVRWTNAEFVAIPRTTEEALTWQGKR